MKMAMCVCMCSIAALVELTANLVLSANLSAKVLPVFVKPCARVCVLAPAHAHERARARWCGGVRVRVRVRVCVCVCACACTRECARVCARARLGLSRIYGLGASW